MCYFCYAQLSEIVHVANIKSTLGNTHAETRKLWCVLPGCRLSKQCPSIKSPAVRCCTSRARRDAHCTLLGSPVCGHCTSPRARVTLAIGNGAGIKSSSRPLLSRCPISRDFVPWRFLDAGQLSARLFRFCRHPKTSTIREVAVSSNRIARVRKRRYSVIEVCLC
jgi:hypothetical protein